MIILPVLKIYLLLSIWSFITIRLRIPILRNQKAFYVIDRRTRQKVFIYNILKVYNAIVS